MPRRPPAKWFERVLSRLKERRDVSDPEAVAGWLWHYGMTPEHRRKILRIENPRVSASLIESAVRQFERFHGRSPKRGDYVNIPDPPRVVVQLGEVIQINYKAKKHGDAKALEYYHRFEKPRPVLMTDAKGRRLFLAGGRYKVTEEGIEG